MKRLSPVLEAAAVLMLGALVAFRPRQRPRGVKATTSRHPLPKATQNGLVTDPSREVMWLLANIDQKLNQLMESRPLGLPWTELLDESGDRQKAIEDLFARRQELKLSLMEELEFSSCAQLTALSYLLEILRGRDEEVEPRVSLAS